MPDPFAPSPRFFDTETGLRLYADDVTMLPTQQVAAKTLEMAYAQLVQWRDLAPHLREPVSPLMMEACMARILGRKRHEELVAILLQAKLLTDTHTAVILEKIATQTDSGLPVTVALEDVAAMLITFMGYDQNIYNFMAQAKKRLAMH